MITFKSDPLQEDMSRRWRPSELQLRVAEAMLLACPEADGVFVPLALSNKEPRVWTTNVGVHPVPGFWLSRSNDADSPIDRDTAKECAMAAAKDFLAEAGVPGNASVAEILRDGGFYLWERQRPKHMDRIRASRG